MADVGGYEYQRNLETVAEEEDGYFGKRGDGAQAEESRQEYEPPSHRNSKRPASAGPPSNAAGPAERPRSAGTLRRDRPTSAPSSAEKRSGGGGGGYGAAGGLSGASAAAHTAYNVYSAHSARTSARHAATLTSLSKPAASGTGPYSAMVRKRTKVTVASLLTKEKEVLAEQVVELWAALEAASKETRKSSTEARRLHSDLARTQADLSELEHENNAMAMGLDRSVLGVGERRGSAARSRPCPIAHRCPLTCPRSCPCALSLPHSLPVPGCRGSGRRARGSRCRGGRRGRCRSLRTLLRPRARARRCTIARAVPRTRPRPRPVPGAIPRACARPGAVASAPGGGGGGGGGGGLADAVGELLGPAGRPRGGVRRQRPPGLGGPRRRGAHGRERRPAAAERGRRRRERRRGRGGRAGGGRAGGPERRHQRRRGHCGGRRRGLLRRVRRGLPAARARHGRPLRRRRVDDTYLKWASDSDRAIGRPAQFPGE